MKANFNRLVRQLKAAMEGARLEAEVIIGSALAVWCRRSFPRLPASGLRTAKALEDSAPVLALVDFVSRQEFVEATYWFASAYAQLAGKEHRERLAMFFTPPSLTARLLDDLAATDIDFGRRMFCDPACGGAAFLVPIALRMRDALRRRRMSPEKILSHVQANLLGFEKEPVLCNLSRHFLCMALYEEAVATGKAPRFAIDQRDSLLDITEMHGTLDVVVCNPPFRKLAPSEASAYAAPYGEVIEAQANLYTLFIAQCVRLLAEGGTCALVTPTSFLSGRNFSKLRTFLMKETNVLSIGMVSDRLGVFMDVEQETALTLARREPTRKARPGEAQVAVVGRDGGYTRVGTCVLPNSGASWPIPRTESDIELLRAASRLTASLSDFGYAIRIGSFVWNRDKRPRYPSAKAAARARGGTAVPLLWSSDIGADGTLQFDGAPKANKEPRFVNLGSRSHPSVVRRPSVLLQRVTSNDQSRRLIAAAVPDELLAMHGGFVGENHTVVLEQVSGNPPLSPVQLAELLSTPMIDRLFRCISGATNVSAFELGQLRLPSPGVLQKLLAAGHDMHSAVEKSIASKR